MTKHRIITEENEILLMEAYEKGFVASFRIREHPEEEPHIVEGCPVRLTKTGAILVSVSYDEREKTYDYCRSTIYFQDVMTVTSPIKYSSKYEAGLEQFLLSKLEKTPVDEGTLLTAPNLKERNLFKEVYNYVPKIGLIDPYVDVEEMIDENELIENELIEEEME